MQLGISKVVVALILLVVVAEGAMTEKMDDMMEDVMETDKTDEVAKEVPQDTPAEGKEGEEGAEEEEEEEAAEEKPMETPEIDSSKKSVKNFTCQVTGAILSMANSIMELDNDIKAIKNQMFEKCPGFNASKTDTLDEVTDSVDALNATDIKTNLEDEPEEGEAAAKEDVLPPIPTECDEPFQPVASSCYYFLYYPHDWKTWGDANAYCQTFGGTLAAPYRYEDLRTYLKENFSNVFWVGAKKSTTKKDTYEWLTGKELVPEDWKEGHPTKVAAKFCVYLESFSGYKAINHYCGEKFSFVCEKRTESE